MCVCVCETGLQTNGAGRAESITDQQGFSHKLELVGKQELLGMHLYVCASASVHLHLNMQRCVSGHVSAYANCLGVFTFACVCVCGETAGVEQQTLGKEPTALQKRNKLTSKRVTQRTEQTLLCFLSPLTLPEEEKQRKGKKKKIITCGF